MASIEVREYLSKDGRSYFRTWIRKLDVRVRARLQARILRLQDGNFGDHHSVGAGVMELRLHFGAGYRVYFGRDGDTLVLLLAGGDKSTQGRDIEAAIERWKEYDNAKEH